MRIIGLDIGTKYIGIAISDETNQLAIPYDVYKRVGIKKDLIYFDSLIKKLNVEKIIVGYPVYLDGKESRMSEYVKKFFYKIRNRWDGVRVILWDETLTTEEAEDIIFELRKKNKKKDKLKDKIAAALILKTYLESVGE
jgi:putative Holliday junction resolvase